MKLSLLGDFRKESGIEEVLDHIFKLGFVTFFNGKNYGADLTGIALIPICQDPSLNLKQRVKFSGKDKFLYVDLMFDLDVMKNADVQTRREQIIGNILSEVPFRISKLKLKDFDLKTFEADLKSWFVTHSLP